MTFSTAVVTGAGSGLGRALALRLARPGAVLLLADLDLAACEETARLARERAATAHAVAVDVADAAQVEALAEDAAQRLGRIDLVVNNAGVAAAGAVGEAPLDDWRWIVGINLFGVIHGCHAFVPRLVAQGGGAILNTASMAGFACAPMMGAYNVTKAGVIALSETLAAEVADKRVRVTVLCPAFFKTNLLEGARATDPQLMAMARGAFARATMSADDVAAAALRAVERGRLYCLPMREGRIVWRLKRLAPQRFVKLVSNQRLQRLAQAKAS
ncbi:SDR family NAD(P)-dependent oxidoreductase [bacterium]|nr:SDR family NAD(P)-dependent oxidoreductase [bacterium]